MKMATLLPVQMQALERIWQQTIQADRAAATTWEEDLQHVYDLGIGMQEMLQFLYGQRPELTTFLQWSHDNSSATDISESLEEPPLTEVDLAHWEKHGYVVLKEAVSEQEHTAANQAIWEFLGASPTNEASWYQPHPAKNGMMVVFTQHKALQAIRQSPRIRKAYEQLYGTAKIYKVIDKVGFNPPQTHNYNFQGSPLHWDTSLQLPIPYKLQGLLYLSDVTAEGGAFQCVPGFHRQMEQWVNEQPAGTDLRRKALETLQPVSISGQAGDFIIWHQALPHCASPNLDTRPRLVQYFTYVPSQFTDNRPWI